jgi:hypothetical protein
MADRHNRAQQALQEGTDRLTDWVEGFSVVLEDQRKAVAAGLQAERFSAQRIVRDSLAITVNFWSAVLGCVAPAAPEQVTLARPAAGRDFFLLDPCSEMSGPLPIPVPSGLDPDTTSAAVTDLNGPGGAVIPSANVVVLDRRNPIKVTLVSLRGVAAGDYFGTLTLTDASGTSVDVPLRACCVDKLWWLAEDAEP